MYLQLYLKPLLITVYLPLVIAAIHPHSRSSCTTGCISLFCWQNQERLQCCFLVHLTSRWWSSSSSVASRSFFFQNHFKLFILLPLSAASAITVATVVAASSFVAFSTDSCLGAAVEFNCFVSKLYRFCKVGQAYLIWVSNLPTIHFGLIPS